MTDSKHWLMQTKIIDDDLEGLEEVLDANGGAELARINKAD